MWARRDPFALIGQQARLRRTTSYRVEFKGRKRSLFGISQRYEGSACTRVSSVVLRYLTRIIVYMTVITSTTASRAAIPDYSLYSWYSSV